MSTPNEPYDPYTAGRETPPSGSQPPSGPQPPSDPQPSSGSQPPSGPQPPPGAQPGPGEPWQGYPPPAGGQPGGYPPAPQYPAPPYGGGYGAQGYGGVPYPKNSLGVWALVLSLVGLFVCSIVGAIPALILAAQSKRAVAAGQANNGGMATAAIVISWITIALAVLSAVLLAIVIATGDWSQFQDSFEESWNSNY